LGFIFYVKVKTGCGGMILPNGYGVPSEIEN